MKINQLIESLRIELETEQAVIYDFDDHVLRLLNSADQLGFRLINTNFGELALYLKNLVKNKAQYQFKKQVVFFTKHNYFRSQNSNSNIYKLNLLVNEDFEIIIKIAPYTRDLRKDWKLKLLSKEDFYINSQDLNFRHKFYPRIDLSQFMSPNTAYDEVLWTNEKDQLCEGSFTNVFLQDLAGNWFTPSLESNILPGILREKLIKELKAKEILILSSELGNYSQILLSNSLIGIKLISNTLTLAEVPQNQKQNRLRSF